MTQIRIPYFTCTEDAQKYGRENAGDSEIKETLKKERKMRLLQYATLSCLTQSAQMAPARKNLLFNLAGEVAVRCQFLREALEAMDESTKIKEGR